MRGSTEKPLTGAMRPDGKALSLAEYEKTGGYEALKKVLRQMTPKEVQEIVKAANLRGRGGAGFPTGVKWGFTPIGEGAPRPKFLISNSDEMEPGAFKDRVLMEGHPHQLIEGMIIAAYAIEAETAYVFLRWGYGASGRRIAAAIREAYEAGYLGPSVAGSRYALEMHVHVSAGRYICGEETALLNALEGKRAIPRAKPPFPGTNGLWGKPTVVNNAETLANVPHIVRHGAGVVQGPEPVGRRRHEGLRGGRAREKAGLVGAADGDDDTGASGRARGRHGRRIRREGRSSPAAARRSSSCPTFSIRPWTFDVMEKKAGSRMGTGTMIVLDDATCPVGMVRNLEEFFARESCGWCTPCRDGLPWIARILGDIEEGRGRPDDLEVPGRPRVVAQDGPHLSAPSRRAR